MVGTWGVSERRCFRGWRDPRIKPAEPERGTARRCRHPLGIRDSQCPEQMGLGLRVWDSGFGVSSLGFRV